MKLCQPLSLSFAIFSFVDYTKIKGEGQGISLHKIYTAILLKLMPVMPVGKR